MAFVVLAKRLALNGPALVVANVIRTIVDFTEVEFYFFIFSANESGDERRALDKTKKRENGGVVGRGKYS